MKNKFADIPVVILCGGKGTRMKDDGELRPKPMVEVGGKPILWHIMKIYDSQGFRRFVLPLGYGGDVIKDYFKKSDWNIQFVETGLDTLKGGRLKRVEKYISSDHFHLTYGDGVSNVNLARLHQFHLQNGKLGTVTVVRPPSRFGELVLNRGQVKHFEEKPQLSTGAINGGFFVFRKEFLNYLSPEKSCDLEFGALQKIAKKGQLKAFRHKGFWQCMDTPREKDSLNKFWMNGAPWRLW